MRPTHQPKEHTTAKEYGDGDALFCLRGHIKLLPQYGKSSKMANLWEGSGQVLVDGNGNPYASWKLYSYETGSTTNKATYSDAGLTSANANPVVADANGRMGDVYLLAGRYKLVFKTSADVTIKTIDPYDSSLELIAATAAPSPTYAFLRYHNTTDGHVYRRNAANSAWIDEGLVDSLGSAATVTQQLAGTATDVFSTPDSVAALWQRGTDIASAATLSIPSTGGQVFNVTGTTGITAIGSAAGGRTLKLKFAAALTITHNATTLILPGAANFTTVAGDVLEFVNEAAADATGSNWRCFNVQTSDNRILLGATQAQQETGTSTTIPVTPGVQHYHQSAAKCWCYITVSAGTPTLQSGSYNITSISDTATGRCTVTIATDFSNSIWCALCTTEGSAATGNHATITAKAAGTVELRNYIEGAAGSLADPDGYNFVGFGDHA